MDDSIIKQHTCTMSCPRGYSLILMFGIDRQIFVLFASSFLPITT